MANHEIFNNEKITNHINEIKKQDLKDLNYLKIQNNLINQKLLEIS